MPDVKIYIRAEDYDKWNAIEMKSQFIHDSLVFYNKRIVPAKAELDRQEFTQVLKAPVDKTCKHGYPSEFCKFAKNGKPCK